MEQFDLLRHLISVFESLGIRYFVTGAIASMFYGEPRLIDELSVEKRKTSFRRQRFPYLNAT